MKLGILYESEEWSIYSLKKNLKNLDFDVYLYNLESNIDISHLLKCNIIINRVFSSAPFRCHNASIKKLPKLLSLIDSKNIPILNPSKTFYYDISKIKTNAHLAKNGFKVPKIYGKFSSYDDMQKISIPKYPCIIKPDCGGRSNDTFIIKNIEDFVNINFSNKCSLYIIQEYIKPAYGYITRIEVIGSNCPLILKRSIGNNGISSYHSGSFYKIYQDINPQIIKTAIYAMKSLSVEFGSLDIIENESGFYIIDINSTSNVSEDNTAMFDFDLMKEMAKYIKKYYKKNISKEIC